MIRRLSALLCSSLISAAVTAHPPDDQGQHDDTHRFDAAHIRLWTNSRTGETVQGAFLSARSTDGVTNVSIERSNGDVVVFDLSDLSATDRTEAQRRIDQVKAINDRLAWRAAEPQPTGPDAKAPAQAVIFNVFAPFVGTRWDDRWLYVESDGLPHLPGGRAGSYVFSHALMVGITAWQQQVPLPQRYRGSNAWQIPLHPALADRPVSAKQQLFRGAIALAANGVPIFNPIKNDGKTDTFLAGELDEFGGHCGRADDYHYHIAPTQLQKFVGNGAPLAYALDGFPVYGFFDPAAPAGAENACPLGGTDKLDELNGHFARPENDSKPGEKGLYHYHASKSYPYLNGGMRGVVTVREDQIDPQPRATPVRDWLQPLRGARITGFKATGERAWSLEYAAGGKPGFVNYRIDGDGRDAQYIFDFITPDGNRKSATYAARTGRDDNQPQDRPPPPPAKQSDQPPKSSPKQAERDSDGFTLSSPDATGGRLSVDCTCDGQSRAPTLRWTNPPPKTRAFALAMHHIPPDGSTHVYMVVANLPSTSRDFNGDPASGLWGPNTVNRKNQYAPPCSQGPGDKVYTITLYALSAEAHPDGPLTRDALLAALKDITLASTSIDVTYARQNNPPDQRGGNPDNRRRRADRNDVPPEGDRQGLRARMTSFKTDVPAHDVDVILARPTDRSITVSVHASDAAEATVEYWPTGNSTRRKSVPVTTGANTVTNIEITGLTPGTEYIYRLGLAKHNQPIHWGDDQRFRTRPAPGTPFTFVMQADSHLDQGVEPAVYEQTLANMLAARPDFVIDLGDTFMTDQRGKEFKSALAQYDAQRYYFGQLARSAPLFMVLGNHDGEKGSSGTAPDDIGPWSFNQRTARFPAPIIDGIHYTGQTTMKDGVGANYYAFQWGDAQLIVLDPFWASTDRIRGGGRGGPQDRQGEQANDQPLAPTDSSWSMTLGRAQYDWLTKTLQSSNARYRFVFIHHLVGGMGGPESRGGVESSRFFEWGGNNADGTPGFAEHRSGWTLPIHDLLAKHHVSAVFHGHDHMYVQSERDGIVYQCVPQPGNPVGNTRSADLYGYKSGTILPGPGHLRVDVAPDKAHVAFIRTAIQDSDKRRRNNTAAVEPNGATVRAYDIKPSPP
ncbi:MAG: YHYH protein [Phycisphaerales bacterium]|nr:YHYH protein [Planctomycetota bacterium]